MAAGERDPGFPDGSVWVRTEPVTHLHDWTWPPCVHDWHQLTYALQGHLEVETDDDRALVPPDCAVWVPAGLRHREAMWAPVRVRTLYLAPGALPDATGRARTLGVGPLLRALVVHACSLGALDRDRTEHAHLIDVLVDQVRAAPEVGLRLPTPRDPRARRLATLLREDPADPSPLAALARRSGASLRTLERRFLAETGLALGEWRRRLRLLHARRLIDAGSTVGEAAAATGYASASAFTAAFTRLFGVAPSRLT